MKEFSRQNYLIPTGHPELNFNERCYIMMLLCIYDSSSDVESYQIRA